MAIYIANCDSKTGLQGSIFGQHFSDILDNCNAAVKSIKIRHEIGNRINGIQLIYEYSNGHGRTVSGNMYGGSGGILSTVNFDINNSERVIAALGYYDSSGIRGLVFFTSLARVYAMDLMEDVPERLSVYEAAKFGDYLEYNSSETLVSIGFYCTQVVARDRI